MQRLVVGPVGGGACGTEGRHDWLGLLEGGKKTLIECAAASDWPPGVARVSWRDPREGSRRAGP